MITDQGRDVHADHGRTGAGRRHLQLTLPAGGQPVRLARQVTCETLAAWRLGHMEETAVPLVAELITNAMRDAACTDAITLELKVIQTWLRIEAYRGQPGLGSPRTADELDKSGFGFALVDCLTGKWGWIAWPATGEWRETATGETVWAGAGVQGQPAPQPR